MVGKDQGVGDDNVLPSSCRKDDDLGDIIRSERFAALVDLVGGRLVTIESDDGEFGLHLTGINLNDSDAGGYKLSAQSIGEAADCGLGCTVDATAGVGLTTCNGADVDNVSGTAIGTSGLEDGENSLGHVDQTCDVRGKHDIDVFLLDLRSFSHTLDEAAVAFVDQYMLTLFR